MGLFGKEFGGCSTEGWNRIGRAGRASGKAVAIELSFARQTGELTMA
jgi:hypothetical protein